jgi:predicted lactoylglutathione lyase
MILSLPSEKIDKILSISIFVLSKRNISIRKLASLIGIYVSAFPAVLLGKFYYRQLEREKIEALRMYNTFEAVISLTVNSKKEIQWWIENIQAQNGCSIKLGSINSTIFTDASNSGWGAWCGTNLVHGLWSESEAIEHINILELKAVWLALLAFASSLRNVHLAVKCDNSTAVAYINNLGGIKSEKLNDLSKQIWLWCYERNIFLSAFHIAGKENIQADYLSRISKNGTEWSLNKEVFWSLSDTFDLQVDLFASSVNKKLEKYVSWGPDMEALANNAFSFDWSTLDYNIYAFPPFSLIDRILEKISKEKLKNGMLLIAPYWPTQAWFPSLLRLAKCPPLRLPVMKTLVQSSIDNSPHPLWQKLHLNAWWI